MSRRKLRGADELEQVLFTMTGMTRNQPLSRTRKDVEKETRKRLGPLWGKKRAPYKPS